MNSTSPKVRIAFVGVGSMGQAAHLRNYASIADCEVTAIAELKKEVAQKVATRYGITKVYPSHEELLANEEFDAIVASQPFSRHGSVIPALAKAGVPIFVEKPIAGSVNVGEAILTELAAHHNWVMVGYHKRSDPAIEWAKVEITRLKASGEIGEIRYIRLTMPPGDWIAGGFNENITSQEPYPELSYDPPPSDIPEAFHKDYEIFVNFYIHQVNLLRFLLGEPYQVSYADPAERVFVGHSQSGIPCTIEMAPFQTTDEWEESALIGFDKGYLKISLPAPLTYNRAGKVEVYTDPGGGVTPTLLTPTLPWVHAMRNQAQNFIKAVRGDAPAPCLAPEALEDLRIAREYIRLLKGF